MSLSFLSRPCSQRARESCDVRWLFALTASGRTARAWRHRSCLSVRQLPLRPGQAGQAGPTICRPGRRPRPHATRRTRLRAHACGTPGERAGALLLPPRRRVSGCFHVTTLVHRPRKERGGVSKRPRRVSPNSRKEEGPEKLNSDALANDYLVRVAESKRPLGGPL